MDSIVCRYFASSRGCRAGRNCPFPHRSGERRRLDTTCRYFLRNRCFFGDRCWYEHRYLLDQLTGVFSEDQRNQSNIVNSAVTHRFSSDCQFNTPVNEININFLMSSMALMPINTSVQTVSHADAFCIYSDDITNGDQGLSSDSNLLPQNCQLHYGLHSNFQPLQSASYSCEVNRDIDYKNLSNFQPVSQEQHFMHKDRIVSNNDSSASNIQVDSNAFPCSSGGMINGIPYQQDSTSYHMANAALFTDNIPGNICYYYYPSYSYHFSTYSKPHAHHFIMYSQPLYLEITEYGHNCVEGFIPNQPVFYMGSETIQIIDNQDTYNFQLTHFESLSANGSAAIDELRSEQHSNNVLSESNSSELDAGIPIFPLLFMPGTDAQHSDGELSESRPNEVDASIPIFPFQFMQETDVQHPDAVLPESIPDGLDARIPIQFAPGTNEQRSNDVLTETGSAELGEGIPTFGLQFIPRTHEHHSYGVLVESRPNELGTGIPTFHLQFTPGTEGSASDIGYQIVPKMQQDYCSLIEMRYFDKNYFQIYQSDEKHFVDNFGNQYTEIWNSGSLVTDLGEDDSTETNLSSEMSKRIYSVYDDSDCGKGNSSEVSVSTLVSKCNEENGKSKVIHRDRTRNSPDVTVPKSFVDNFSSEVTEIWNYDIFNTELRETCSVETNLTWEQTEKNYDQKHQMDVYDSYNEHNTINNATNVASDSKNISNKLSHSNLFIIKDNENNENNVKTRGRAENSPAFAVSLSFLNEEKNELEFQHADYFLNNTEDITLNKNEEISSDNLCFGGVYENHAMDIEQKQITNHENLGVIGKQFQSKKINNSCGGKWNSSNALPPRSSKIITNTEKTDITFSRREHHSPRTYNRTYSRSKKPDSNSSLTNLSVKSSNFCSRNESQTCLVLSDCETTLSQSAVNVHSRMPKECQSASDVKSSGSSFSHYRAQKSRGFRIWFPERGWRDRQRDCVQRKTNSTLSKHTSPNEWNRATVSHSDVRRKSQFRLARENYSRKGGKYSHVHNAMPRNVLQCTMCSKRLTYGSDRIMYGVLENCNHVYCLQCIYWWRSIWRLSINFIGPAVACFICEMLSSCIVPTKTAIENSVKKMQVIEKYKRFLRQIHCKYFRRGRGNCLLGSSCLYLHEND